MKISIDILNKDVNRDILRPAYRTMGREYNGEKIGAESFKKWMVSEHSVIESVYMYLQFSDVSKDFRNQFIRATKGLPRPYCETSRPDRTGKPRDNNALTNFDMTVNPLSLIFIARQRMCNGTEMETRNITKQLKKQLMKSDEPFLKALGWAMVPNCVYRSGCCEPWQKCEWYSFWSDVLGDEEKVDIFKRYDKFNEEFMIGATL